MIDVGVFGCSFSSNREFSWPRLLADKHKGLNIFDYSVPGTSIEYSLYQLNNFKRDYPHARTIFQITNPYRITKVKGKNKILSETENYSKVKPNKEYVTGYTVGDIGIKRAPLVSLLESRIKLEDEKMYKQVVKSIYFYIYNSTDIHFMHLDNKWFEGLDIYDSPIIKNECSEEQWNGFCISLKDTHFNDKGHNWLCDWVHKKVERWN